MTLGDWNCYYKANQQAQQPSNSNSNSTSPIINNATTQQSYTPIPSATNTTSTPNTVQNCTGINNAVASLKAGEQAAVNSITQAETAQLGARGLLPSSPEGQTAISQALLPIYANWNYQIASVCLQAGSCPCP